MHIEAVLDRFDHKAKSMFGIYSFYFCHQRGYPPLACVIYSCNSFCYQTLWLYTSWRCAPPEKHLFCIDEIHMVTVHLFWKTTIYQIFYVQAIIICICCTPTYIQPFLKMGQLKCGPDLTLALFQLTSIPLYMSLVMRSYYTSRNEVVGGYTGFTMSVCL